MVTIGNLILSISAFVIGWRLLGYFRVQKSTDDWLKIILSLGVLSLYTKEQSVLLFTVYVIGLSVNFLALKLTPRFGFLSTCVKFLPLLYLVIYKVEVPHNGIALLGVSYLCLRLLRFNVDYKNEIFISPSLSQYFKFSFFYPTFIVGPINKFSEFSEESSLDAKTIYDSCLRILVGVGKYFVLGLILSRLDFTNLWNDGRLHGVFDFFISCTAYFLYLYCNFSGFIDIMMGTARLCGVALPENFNSPFSSRNIKEFWNRWHITLSSLARDIIFTPLSKFLVRLLGPKFLDWVISISILSTFLLVGVWHGNGYNYVIFGVWHGVGLALNHWYTVILKKRLGKKLRDYEQNRWIKMMAISSNFVFVSIGMFFFENNWAEIKIILDNVVRFYAI